MAEDKKTVVIYTDWIDKFEALDDVEAGRLIKHFFRYVNDLNPVAPDRITQLSFIDIEKTLKRDLVKWEKRAERSRLNGALGGRPPKQENLEKPKETKQVILEPKKPVNVNGNVSVNVNDNVIKPIDTVPLAEEPVQGKVKKENKKEVLNEQESYFLKIFNNTTGRDFKTLDNKTKVALAKIIKDGYKSAQIIATIKTAIPEMTGRGKLKYLTPEFITREVEFLKYYNMINFVDPETTVKEVYKPITKTIDHRNNEQ
jgi:hypothetical protein